ncbi:hypothetical protein ACFW35_18360 [Fictibacillus sp. NPDC058756]|jgi:hypothetical protein|uniref:hypothetical protein n=1 Tax=Fictibacillus sp. NPDC058756 TaxID=3346625 RepID=UPI0036A1696C
MKWKYWKVVLRYGHVGRKNEVSVARFLITEVFYNPIMVMDLASEMPGVKCNGISQVNEIYQEEYLIGKRKEVENFYLQKLKEGNGFTS